MIISTLPYFCLLWIGIGFVFILIGFFMAVSNQQHMQEHVPEFNNKEESEIVDIKEMFSFFLEEEEKKNEHLRNTLLKKEQQVENLEIQKEELKKETTILFNNQRGYDDIIRMYKEGMPSEVIAKTLHKGIGEVNLMISLYNMR